jgi:hypothetical protein
VVFLRKEIFVILGLMAALLMITSCMPAAKYYVCTDGRKVLDPALCTAQQPQQPAEGTEGTTTPAEEEPAPEPEKPVHVEMTDEAKALFDKLAKVTGLQFYYVESPNVLPDSHYYMTKDKMKIALKTRIKFTQADWYDTVYLDLVNKKAVAYCEERNTGMCPDRDKAFDVDYKKFAITTPFDWVARLAKANLTGQSKTIENRKAIEVAFIINDQSGTMFADSFYGVPMIVYFNNKTYAYLSLAENEVDQTEVEHQFGQ